MPPLRAPLRVAAALLLLGACPAPRVEPAPAPDGWVLRGATLVLGADTSLAADLIIRDGRIASLGPADPALPVVEHPGTWVVPSFIDSHVHLAYRREPLALARSGVAAAIDLGAPLVFAFESHAPLEVRTSGPMLTAPGGYPTQSWGRDGFGLEVGTVAEGEAAVDRLAAAGLTVVKLPWDQFGPPLDPAVRSAVIARAHQRGMKVAAHALTDEAAAAAAAAGADVLAHLPADLMQSATVMAWAGKAVIPTLAAFGGGSSPLANLRALRAAGATVLYGTDFGNGSTTGLDAREVALLQRAGLDGAAILEAGTSAPAAFWGFPRLGRLAPGMAASLVVLDADPRVDPATLGRVKVVYLDGVLVEPR